MADQTTKSGSSAPKPPRRKKDWVGRRVRSRRTIANAVMSMPAGTIWTVARNWGGLELWSDPCERCQAKMRVTRVPENAVELLPEGTDD